MLPSSLISTMALSAARGGVAESEFLSKRQSSWEDSFHSIYYMFRKRKCDIFYFCTQQFIVMFMGGNLNEKMQNTCAAYLTKSTGGFRAFLKKHDVDFSMPLCSIEVEQATTEDLHELSKFEKINLGSFLSSVDSVDVPLLNSPVPFQNASLHFPEWEEAVCKPSIRVVVQNLDSTENYSSV